jgi:hypothetical protein
MRLRTDNQTDGNAGRNAVSPGVVFSGRTIFVAERDAMIEIQ